MRITESSFLNADCKIREAAIKFNDEKSKEIKDREALLCV
jgi:hypothetical protein